ncbi:multicopper oxidase domain-containing protein [Nocardia coubleae]|uniref:Multicopper oxidase CueO n=2 Tax=Nocardia coubleae TaxID=356147 RepID=A0A846W0P6_9NOCA|nr:multicopper oxidase domain-containing protein [Nocardia coubleae]
MMISRRGFLRAGIALGAAVAVGAGVPRVVRPGQPGLLLPSAARLPAPFQTQLPVPPELAPFRSDATTDYYEIIQRTAQLDILPDLRTEAWTYHGSFPGPTIRARSGRATSVRHRNELPHPTVVHLHGGHTPADSDGYPMDVILPVGATSAPQHNAHGHGAAATTGNLTYGERTYLYPNRQRAASLWYHDHRHSFTGPAVWRGLAGFHLVGDEIEDSLPLPRGNRDIPLFICDRSFAEDGSFAYPLIDPDLHTPGVTDRYMNGVLGDVVLVNGAPWPRLEVSPVRYRFRLLNGSNARRYRLTLEPGSAADPFVQIGSDGGLLDRPLPHNHIDISPGERFDVVIDFAAYPPGTSVRLRNAFGTGPVADILRFDITGPTRYDDTAVPDRLAPVERLDPATAVAERTFLFQLGPNGWSINGRPYEPGRALAAPRLGTVEIWRFITDVHHPVHVHLDPFQVISRNNRPPGPFDAGWKDTVDVRPAEAVEVAVRFTDYPGPFMLHCHNLEHEDMAMMGDFVVS